MDPRLEPVAERVPIFPLAHAVLMPGALLPLHVFEPRYRALLAHCLETHQLMGIATLDLSQKATDPQRPPIYPELGIGSVVAHQLLPDGRSNVTLEFVGRGFIEEELPNSLPFREVRCRFDEPTHEGFDRASTSLEHLVLQIGALLPAASAEARKLVTLPPVELVDALARRTLGTSEEQRRYLSAARLVERVAMVEDYLSRYLLGAPPTATD